MSLRPSQVSNEIKKGSLFFGNIAVGMHHILKAPPEAFFEIVARAFDTSKKLLGISIARLKVDNLPMEQIKRPRGHKAGDCGLGHVRVQLTLNEYQNFVDLLRMRLAVASRGQNPEVDGCSEAGKFLGNRVECHGEPILCKLLFLTLGRSRRFLQVILPTQTPTEEDAA